MGLGRWFGVAKKIPVLAYDAASMPQGGGSASWQEQLEAQWAQLADEGYHCLSLDDFLNIAGAGKPAPDKASLITFDGVGMLKAATPLLEKMAWRATVFLPGKALTDTHLQDFLRSKSTAFQIAMGGFDGEDYAALQLADAKECLETMVRAFDSCGLNYHKVMAYPQGNMPKGRHDLILLKALMADAGIEAAFRLDDRPARSPCVDFYEISRISISMEDTAAQLKLKIQK